MSSPWFEKSWAGYLIAVGSVVTLTAALKLFSPHINAATVALTFLLIVLFVATWRGAKPAVVASVLGLLCFNFFFLPPFGTLTVEALDSWISLLAFLVTAITVGQLSANAKRRAEEAETGRREIERQSEEHTSELQSRLHLVCRLLLEKKK